MSKKDKSQVMGGDEGNMMEASSPATATEEFKAKKRAEASSPATTTEEFKAKKRAAAERFKENKKKEKKARIEGAKALIDEMKNAGLYDQLSDSAKDFLNNLANPVSGNATTGSTFMALFGAAPKVGDKVTLIEAFQRTLKGKSNIDAYIKKWAEKGIVVSFQQDVTDIRNSVYTLEALGN